ncbi:hypothetical protein F8388_007483 [Cannabis sativa]|uniref:non-specific serine/threonine protein kinase n=1 Tax=Cannabis sativa TaxID=3483 RepID=A0A7J6F7E0_CANSA|nr:hypothetical protein F8388_007483 [Cannabis sativa]
MMTMSGGSSSLLSIFTSIFTIYVVLFAIINASLTTAQNRIHDQSTTDPSEVRALNSMFEQWKIKADTKKWNISGEPCSGSAIDDSIDIEDNDSLNPFIKCDCTFNNGSLCHITKLKVYQMDAVGPIPEELWTLTFLSYLNLGYNFLTGSVSPSIGTLINMKYLSLAGNALSGELPKELGLLTQLLSLLFSENNFSGTLPPELGNLKKLQYLIIASSGVSGKIPSTFANLQSMQILWAQDNELIGKIPDFIGSWAFQGNSLQGPIPSTFANLTSLTELRLSEISNASSTLAFVTNMKSLSFLELRNSEIIGSIPSNINKFTKLTHLDLSFNKLNGQIPDSLFNMSSLSALFLGNNSLNGTLPQQKISASLLIVDLSYNNLVGNIPSWINNQQNLQLNLVGNNLTIDNSSNSTLLLGLNCLQRNFPCNRDRPLYSNFGINCGGEQISSSNGIVYEKDDEALGPATHFVTSSKRWAVSNVGLFSWTDVNPNSYSYTSTSSSKVTSTLDSGLFQTVRLSSSSLRYYGLGLENGNYTVKLHFAETAFENSRTWKSLGRRIFDIYIQGNRVIQNFDIRKEAGGISFRAVQKEFKARVSQNYLEIHLLWAGKGTCCIPNYGTYGPSISAISVIPDFTPTVSDISPALSKKKNQTSMIVGIIVGAFILSFFGYLAPEYAMLGHLTEKTDVFAFGVVALEILTGRPNYDQSLAEEKAYLFEWAWNMYEDNREIELIDSTLSEFNKEEVRRIIQVAFLCTRTSPTARPSMSKVVALLSGDTDVNTEVSRPGYLVDWKFNDVNDLLSRIAQGSDPTLYSLGSSTSMESAQSIQWMIKAGTQQWNISGELCSGAAVDDSIDIDDDDSLNPLIKCNCTFSNASLCHITKLKVSGLNVIGPIPEELWTLTFLSYLDLSSNLLTGSISPLIGNLTNIQYLSLGINALSGEVPKELGQLTELIILTFSLNNFSGPLPPELGNLNKLEQLLITSSGVSGEIPSTFANLQSMQTFWVDDNELTGKIPNFVGSWSNLTSLALSGNSIQGPIPSTFANLTSLTDMWLSEISNASSTLAFLTNMKSLSFLQMRNSDFSGSIPSNIGELRELKQLDLSFNKLNGQIPDSLFNMSSLSALFLGNNSLNGTLPQRKIASLLTIDLSYNNLVGTIPSWVNNQQNLQLNLVGNNFIIDNSNNSTLLLGLNCLQRNFPCNQDRPLYSNFAINCGGKEIKSSDGVVYEKDDNPLGPATHFVTSSKRWAVSNVGLFLWTENAKYISTSSQFTSTLDSGLFQTARLSASSLRYYGLGLQNGNYNVKLQFAETAFENSQTWKSIGRRVFDIYIQGNRVIQNFDIRKEAGGISFKEVQKEFKARVSQNYLEIHLFWAGEGTCCMPVVGTYGPSISAISAIADFTPTLSNIPPTLSKKKNQTSLIVGIIIGTAILSFLSVLVAFYVVQTRKKSQMFDDDGKHFSIGYLAPEYAMLGHLTEKTDVFAFGVVALEILTGRPNSDPSLGEEKAYLLEWAWNLYEDNREIELIDSTLSEFNKEEVRRIIQVAFLCTRTSPTARPSMSKVVALLSGDTDVNTEVSRPGYLVDWKFNDVNALMSRIAQGPDPTLYSLGSSSSREAVAVPPPGDGLAHPVFQETNSECVATHVVPPSSNVGLSLDMKPLSSSFELSATNVEFLSSNFELLTTDVCISSNGMSNLVGNNFTIDNSNNSNFLLDSNFAINCGGEQITSSDGVVYEKDDETLGPATHFVTRSKRWAVSNVGRFAWNDNLSYTSTSSSQITNTLDSELFQTARISASSLRYYGLGLQNGNYTVKLHFAETTFENSRTWTSLGRRIFDIFIQGNRVMQNFDIRKEAGVISFRAVQKEFKAVVSQNYLEIHLFWAGKGTCCIPTYGDYGPSISAISATQDFTPTVSNISPSLSNKKSRTRLIAGITVGVVILSFMSILVAFYLIQRRKKSQMNDDDDGTHFSIHFGYLAPEYAMLGHLTEKTDVFAFGVVALEILTGRPNSDPDLGEEKAYLLEWAWNLHEEGREIELVDSKLSEFIEQEVRRIIQVAFLCTRTSPTARPSMSKVVTMLSVDPDVDTEFLRPSYLVDWKYNDVSSLMSRIAQGTDPCTSMKADA